jgi:hypothetical protein
VIDFDAEIDASKALREAIDNASDGDTIGVCGSLTTESLCLGRPHGPAVRLIGMNAEQPWFFVHGASWEDCAQPTIVPKLQKAEKEAAACLGFPSAHIHVDSNCLEISIPLWLERVRLTSGSRERGGRARFWEGMTENDTKYLGAEFHAAVCLFEERNDQMTPLVMQKVWLTSYWGSCVNLGKGSFCAMLQCCITNSLMAAVVCETHSSLRLRGCHIICNPGVGSSFTTKDQLAQVSEAQMSALHASNVFYDNNGNVYEESSTANELLDAVLFSDDGSFSARVFT